MSRIKNVNTNTNINRININVPRQYRPRQPKKKTVAQAEEALSQDENQDRQASYQTQGISINPNVYGFNTSPINREVGIVETRPETKTAQTQTQTTKGRSMGTSTRNMSTEPIETQTDESLSSVSPRMAVAEPIPFKSTSVPVDKTTLARRYSEPEFSFNRPSDFQDRLSRQEGFQPQSSFAPFYPNHMRNIQKQGRPDLDINLMARNVREAYRGEEQIVPFAKQAGGGSVKDKILSIEETQPTLVYSKAFEKMPLEEALPPAKKGKGGRPVGSKNKPKPKAITTQTGESLLANVNTPREEIQSLGTQMAEAQKAKKAKKALRGKGLFDIQED